VPRAPPDADYDGTRMPTIRVPTTRLPAMEPVVFAGSGRSRAEELLGYVCGRAARAVPADVTAIELIVVVDPRWSRTACAARRPTDLTAASGPFCRAPPDGVHSSPAGARASCSARVRPDAHNAIATASPW
jgi:hypothetical protein